MKWLNKLERKFGGFGIRNLMKYIVMLSAVAFVIVKSNPTGEIYERLMLSPEMVWQGEVWRLITFIFLPDTLNLFWAAISLYFYYFIGSTLENEWGTFRFNLYYFVGIIGTVIVAMVFGIVATPAFINLSLFLAFATIYPNHEFTIYFVLPVKAKYLALLDWGYFALAILTGAMPTKLIAIVGLVNYFAFFGLDIVKAMKENRQIHSNRQRFRREIPRNITYHRCTVCGKTEKDDPKLEFRYCNICEGDYEYCMEHVRNHEHIVNKQE